MVNSYDKPQTLMLKTAQLLESRDITQIHRDTGIPYHWLTKFVRGGFTNPSVNRVQYLYEHLTGVALCN